jgi:hypothetical protein
MRLANDHPNHRGMAGMRSGSPFTLPTVQVDVSATDGGSTTFRSETSEPTTSEWLRPYNVNRHGNKTLGHVRVFFNESYCVGERRIYCDSQEISA